MSNLVDDMIEIARELDGRTKNWQGSSGRLVMRLPKAR